MSGSALLTNTTRAVKARRLAGKNTKSSGSDLTGNVDNTSSSSFDNGVRWFGLNSKTGELSLVKDLDYEQHMQVRCC